MVDYSLLEVAFLRQQEMLKEAEARRLYQQLQKNHFGVVQQIGGWLADAVGQLKTHSQSNLVMPMLRQK